MDLVVRRDWRSSWIVSIFSSSYKARLLTQRGAQGGEVEGMGRSGICGAKESKLIRETQ